MMDFGDKNQELFTIQELCFQPYIAIVCYEIRCGINGNSPLL